MKNILFKKTILISCCIAVCSMQQLLGTEQIASENAIPSVQQSKRITGTVTDQKGEPLIGVNVTIKGGNTGTITDIDGNYQLENVPENATLTFSYIGYLTQEVNVSNQTTIRITLLEDTQTLEEVVVVGYGSFKKRDLTGAISQVKGEDIANLPLRSAADALHSGSFLFVYLTTGFLPYDLPGLPYLVC